MSTHYRKMLTQWVSLAESLGWTVDLTPGGRWRFCPPSGQQRIVSRSPSDYRSTKNARADLRRAGLPIPRG